MKIFILLIVNLTVYGCATVGPTIVIETDEPAEDFLALCKKDKSYLFKIGHTASRYTAVDHVIVTESGKEVDCGLMVGGSGGSVTTMHPTLTGDGTQNYEKDGIRHIVYNKTKLDLLDEQKAKFESGYWDKYRNPGRSYLGSRSGCGFPHQYFEYYKEAADIDVQYFKATYHVQILQCMKKAYAETEKHDPYSAKQMGSPEKRMERLWKSIEGTVKP